MKTFHLTTFFFLALSSAAVAQSLLKGTLRDTRGAPLNGATVEIRSTGAAAVTDSSGHFTIAAPSSGAYVLSAGAAGFEFKDLPLKGGRESVDITLSEARLLEQFLVTSRRRTEPAQAVPIPISVISGALADQTQAFNVNRLKELIPSVQLYSSNPRNTAINIRGLGTTFGLTNDGIDQGVGFYVDGVFYARPAAATLDFIDVERIEVLRGPQGTLFGKNTTAGAFNISTRKPSFTPGAVFEASYGDYGFVQSRSSITGPLSKKLAGRLSFSATKREGTLDNIALGQKVNTLDNLGVRGQLLYTPSDTIDVILSADLSRQRPVGYAQVFAGVAPTLRAAYRQFDAIIADLGYTVPSKDPFDRKIDHDTPWRSGQDFGGASLNADVELASGTLTATTAWRFWNWDPSNDRDFTGLQALSLSQAPSTHEQWSQEVRWAGPLASRLSGVFGLYALAQKLEPDSAHTEESGRDQWRFSQSSTSALWQTPGLLDGYGIKSYPKLETLSSALFGQVDWSLTDRWSLLLGARFNYDDKEVDYRRETYGGLQTNDAALLALKRGVYSDQAFKAQVDDTNFSGQITTSYAASEKIKAFATYATSYKPVGLNLGGLPTESGRVMVELAVIKPEEVSHFEAGFKASPTSNSVVNLSVFNTGIKDYQTLVQAADLALNRGYLANAEKVRVRGAELDANVKWRSLSVYGALAYTEGEYVKFTNAPPPLEETGGPTFKDISGGELPGISKWAGSLGAEITRPHRFLNDTGELFLGVDTFSRSSFSSSASPSRYLRIGGYTVINFRVGFRASHGLSVTLWARNAFDEEYFEQLLPAGGNAGHYAAVLGDPRTVGVTLKYSF